MWKSVETDTPRVSGVNEVQNLNPQQQFQQTGLMNFYSQKLFGLVVVMSIVELWKAPQTTEIKNVSSKLACGIFVMRVEIRRAAPSSHVKCPKFSSLFNNISPTCPPVIHSVSLARSQRSVHRTVDLTQQVGKHQRPESVRAKGKSNLFSKETYWRASIRRVMVRFKSLSERRISSILLMECRTVV